MSSEFYIPETVSEAVNLKETLKRAFYLGGGTILNAWTKKSAKKLISLHKLGLKSIERQTGFISIGAMTTLTELFNGGVMKDNYPLEEILKSCKIVSKNIRNMATVGGVLGSRYTRSDFLPLFLVLEAEVVSITSEGERRESVEDFLMRPPSKSGLITNILVKEDREPFFFKSARFARNSNDLPVIKMAVFYTPLGTTMTDLKIAAGGLYDKPVRLYELEEALEGKNYDDDKISSLIGETLNQMAPARTDLRGNGDFKKAVAASLLEDIIAAS